MLGTWDINVTTSGMPNKIATAFGDLGEGLIGAQYTPIAYLGSQSVNGVNHAVLAEQVIVTGKDVKNVVIVIFNEKPEGASLVSIERVIEAGGQLGGINVDPTTEIPDAANKAFTDAFNERVGVDVNPFALLGTQLVNGTNYIFAATLTPVTEHPISKAVVVTVNDISKDVSIVDILTSKSDSANLGYAFTWLRK